MCLANPLIRLKQKHSFLREKQQIQENTHLLNKEKGRKKRKHTSEAND